MADKVWVSYNQPINKVLKEETNLEEKGYLVVDSYGNDFDIGNIFEYAHGEDSAEVFQRHYEHMKRCAI